MKKSLLLFPLLASFGAVSRADLAYTQVTSSPFGAMMGGAGTITSKVYAKGNSSRTESQVFGRKTVTLVRGAKNVVQIDPATKTYTVSNTGLGGTSRAMGAGGKAPAMNISVSTQKLGVATIRGVKAPHYRVNLNMQMNTPRGPQNVKMAMEVWNSGVALPMSAQTRADAMQKLPDNLKSMLGSKSIIKGDLKGLSAAFSTVPLRMKMMVNGRAISTTETSAISKRVLPASLFAVPAGYRAISTAQFNQMQQAAMRQSLAGLMKGMPGR